MSNSSHSVNNILTGRASIPPAHSGTTTHNSQMVDSIYNNDNNGSSSNNSKSHRQLYNLGLGHHQATHQPQGNSSKRRRVADPGYLSGHHQPHHSQASNHRGSSSHHSNPYSALHSARSAPTTTDPLSKRHNFADDHQREAGPLVKSIRTHGIASKCDKSKEEKLSGRMSNEPEESDAPLNLCVKRPTSSAVSSATAAASASSSSSARQHQQDVNNTQQQRAFDFANSVPLDFSSSVHGAEAALHLPRKRGRKPKSLLASSSAVSTATAPSLPIIVVPSAGESRPRKRGRPPILSPPPNIGPLSHGAPWHPGALGLEGLQMISNRQASSSGALPSTQLQPGWPSFSSAGQIIFPTVNRGENGNSSTKAGMSSSRGQGSSTRNNSSNAHAAMKPSETSETDEESDASKAEYRNKTVNEEEIRLPLRFGWKRHTIMKYLGISGVKGEILYFSPDGKKIKSQQEVVRYITKYNAKGLSTDNFSFSSQWLVGEFIEPGQGGRDPMILSESEVINRIDQLKRLKRRRNVGSKDGHNSGRPDRSRKQRESTDNESMVAASTSQHEELISRLQSEFTHQELLNIAGGAQLNELKILEMLQALKQSHTDARDKQKEDDILKKIQERELKRQQAEQLKEQELQRRKEMQMMQEIERERRRQHMQLLRAMDVHKRFEERERKKEELLAEKRALQERKIQKKRIEMELQKELKKPIDDMMLKDLQPYPTLNRIPGLKLPGKAFAETLMVFEFLHNFGGTLGFDMDSLPTINTLQLAMLNLDEGAEEELLSVLHHLLVCAIDDPGTPVPVTTTMGTKLKDAPISNYNITEILRVYFHSFSLAGREDYSENKIFEILNSGKQFLSLNPTQKAEIISYLCNELLCNQAVVRQVDDNIESVATLRRDKWVVDCELRKYKTIRQKREDKEVLEQEQLKKNEEEREEKEKAEEDAEDVEKKEPQSEDDQPDERASRKKTTATVAVDGEAALDEDSGDSGAENDENTNNNSQIDQDEEPGMTNEELDKKIDKLTRQCTMATNKLNKAVHSLRVSSLGQDRYRRRYWVLPAVGGVFVEGMESAEPGELAENEPVDDANDLANKINGEKSEDKEENNANKDECEKMETRKEDEDVEKVKVKSEVESMDQDEDGVTDSKKEITTEEDTNDNTIVNAENHVNGNIEKADDETELDKEGETKLEKSQDGKEGETTYEDVKVNGLDKAPKDEAVEGLKAQAKQELQEKESAESPWLSPIVASVLAGSMMFGGGHNSSTNGFSPFNFPFGGKNGNSSATDQLAKTQAQQKPWFSILPRVPCCETITEPATKSDGSDAEATTSSAGDKASLLGANSSALAGREEIVKAAASGNFSNLAPELFMQAFLNPQILNSLFRNNQEKSGTASTTDLSESATERPSACQTPKSSRDAGPKDSACDTPIAASTPVPSSMSALSCLPFMNASIEDMLDICPSLQKKLTTQREQQYDESLKIPAEFQFGWWRITDASQLKAIIEVLHDRGVRERHLHKHLLKYFNYITTKCKSNVAELDISDYDRKVCEECPFGAPKRDGPDSYNLEVACRIDVVVLEQIESLEEKIANSSMQIRGWKPMPKLSNDPDVSFEHELRQLNTDLPSESIDGDDDNEGSSKDDDEGDSASVSKASEAEESSNPVVIARKRLLATEAVIERRYLKPPLGYKSNTVIINATGVDEYAENAADENAPSGLVKWRDAVRECTSGAQLAMLLHFLENCIAWDKSIMRASCQFCSSGENEAQLLLCDSCDRGYHTYCFKPRMENIPDGDWFCFECQNKNTIDKVCVVCGKKGKLLNCDTCPKVFHPNCVDPPVTKPAKGRWCCHMCNRIRPRKYSKPPPTRKPPCTVTAQTIEEKSTKEVPTVQEPESEVNESPAKESKKKGKGKGKKASKASIAATEKQAQAETSLSEIDEKPVKEEKEKKKKTTAKDKDAKDLASLETLVSEMMNHEEAWPFQKAVNTKQFPTYKKIIKKPMDLTTIKQRLETGSYKTRGDFLADVRLIFDNCETFNEDESPVGQCGHTLRKFFEKRWKELFE